MARDANDRNVATGIEKRTITNSVSANEVNHPPRALSASVNGRVQMAVAKIVVVTTIKTSEAAANQATGLHRDDRRWPSGNHRNKKGSNAIGYRRDGVRDPAEDPSTRERPGIRDQSVQRERPGEPAEPQGEPAGEQQPADRVLATSSGDHDAQHGNAHVDQQVEDVDRAPTIGILRERDVAIHVHEQQVRDHQHDRGQADRPRHPPSAPPAALVLHGLDSPRAHVRKEAPSTRRAPTAAPPSDRARGR